MTAPRVTVGHRAEDLVASFPDGVWLVDLAPLNDLVHLPAAVAALGVREVAGQDPLATLAADLRARHVLLVLDNCEHLVAACATLAEQIVRAAPNVSILDTSRERLRAEGETIYLVSSLATPPMERLPSVDEAPPYPAVRLFVDRASSTHPGCAASQIGLKIWIGKTGERAVGFSIERCRSGRAAGRIGKIARESTTPWPHGRG